MKFDKWTVGLTAAGVLSLGSAVADESPVTSLVSGTTISGYVDTSAIFKPGSETAMASRFGNTGSDRFDGFNLNVAALTIQKPLDEAQWSAGYRVDLWFGPDASSLVSSTLGDGDLALKQAYVALRAPVGNGLDFKIGQVDTIIGYEVADSYANPNFSRSLGFFLEPLTHTGVIASYQLTEWLGIAGGITDTAFGGVNVKKDNPGTFTYLGALTLQAPESWGFLEGSSLYAGLVDGGDESADGSSDTLNYYVGVSVPTPIEQITVGASFDYLTGGAYDDSWAMAVGGYISWQLTEKLKFNTRAEYAKSGYSVWASEISPDDGNKLLAITGTLDYSLWANVISRLEVIWDHDLKGDDSFEGKNNAWLLAANLIYRF